MRSGSPQRYMSIKEALFKDPQADNYTPMRQTMATTREFSPARRDTELRHMRDGRVTFANQD